MGKFKDLTGHRFGQWTVIERVLGSTSPIRWLCRCDCGNEGVVAGNHLPDGRSTSCGCSMATDLLGQRFTRWTVIERADNKGRNTAWLCRCDCGIEKVVLTQSLRSGLSQSCGCLQRERTSAAQTTHGRSSSRLYAAWLNMKQRCENPNRPSYRNYGARGITIDPVWSASFEQFAADVGEPPAGLSLDRIDNDGPYTKANVRWATWSQQMKNRRARTDWTATG